MTAVAGATTVRSGRTRPNETGPVNRTAGWLSELYTQRELLYMITLREIKVKYKQSVMGFLWAIFMPAIIVSAGVLVKYAFSSLSGSPLETEDIISVAVRSVPWAFFVAALQFASTSLIANQNLVTKIYMPREIFPIAAVASSLVDFMVASAVVGILVAVAGVDASKQLLWIPVLTALIIVLVTGLGILLSAAALFFRDVKYIVQVIITFAIFFTPVFYEAEMFGQWANVLLLNPIAPLLEGISAAVLGQPLPGIGWMTYSALFSVGLCATAVAVFKRLEPYFAESV